MNMTADDREHMRRVGEHAALVWERDSLLRDLEARTAAVSAAVASGSRGDLPRALAAHADALAALGDFLTAHPEVVKGRD